MAIMLKCVKVKMPLGLIERSRDGSKKTNLLIKLEPTTLTKNHLRKSEKKPRNVKKYLENFVETEIPTS